MGNALRVAGAATVAAVAIVAAGCGSASSPSASSAGATTTTTTTPGSGANGAGANTADRTAFNACLAQHGVTLPSRPPGGGGGGGNGQPPAGGPGGGGGGLANLTAAQRAAFTACRSKLPARGFGGGGGNRANNPAFAKYNACLKQHGVTLGKSNDQTTFAKAQAACAKLAPTGGPAAGAGAGGGTSIQ
jgi:hypothetical protein